MSSSSSSLSYILDHRWLRIISVVFYILCAVWSIPLLLILWHRLRRASSSSTVKYNTTYFQLFNIAVFAVMFLLRIVSPLTFAIEFYSQPHQSATISHSGAFAFTTDFTSMALFFEVFALVLLNWVIFIRLPKQSAAVSTSSFSLSSSRLPRVHAIVAMSVALPLFMTLIPVIAMASLHSFHPASQQWSTAWSITAALFIILPSILLSLAALIIGILLIRTYHRTAQYKHSPKNKALVKLTFMVVAFIAGIAIRIIASPVALLVFSFHFNRNIGYTLANPVADSIPAVLMLGLATRSAYTHIKEYRAATASSITASAYRGDAASSSGHYHHHHHHHHHRHASQLGSVAYTDDDPSEVSDRPYYKFVSPDDEDFEDDSKRHLLDHSKRTEMKSVA